MSEDRGHAWITFTADVEVLIDVVEEYWIWEEQVGVVYDFSQPDLGIKKDKFTDWLSVRVAEHTSIECYMTSAQMTDYCSDDNWRLPIDWDFLIEQIKSRIAPPRIDQPTLPGM